jgi:hypothetical protein
MLMAGSRWKAPVGAAYYPTSRFTPTIRDPDSRRRSHQHLSFRSFCQSLCSLRQAIGALSSIRDAVTCRRRRAVLQLMANQAIAIETARLQERELVSSG